jgi:hypothetical protein
VEDEIVDNDELLVMIKDLFETKIEEVKRHMGVLTENLENKVQIVAEGHELINRKIDNNHEILNRKIDDSHEILIRKIDDVKLDVKGIKSDMTVVKDYIIGVDAKLNEHDIILKRAK